MRNNQPKNQKPTPKPTGEQPPCIVNINSFVISNVKSNSDSFLILKPGNFILEANRTGDKI